MRSGGKIMLAERYNTYGTGNVNKDTTKENQGKFYMNESGYERFETQNESGIRICFEFPKHSVNEEHVLQEVKDILIGELRETIYKVAG